MNTSTSTTQVFSKPQSAARSWSEPLVLLGLFLLGFLSRLPFIEKVFYHWDSINFAFSLQRFDVAAGQPQVPGYILYVALGRLFNLVFGDAQSALVAISLVSSGLAVAALYVLGKTIFNRTVGLMAALFLAASPLYWFYGELALPHTLDGFVVIVAALLAYRIARGEHRLALPAAVWLAIAGGLRPQTELFLAPLAVYALARLVSLRGWRQSLRDLALPFIALVVLNLAWFIPLMVLSGGIRRYLEITSAFSAYFNTTTTIVTGGLFGLTRNLRKLSMYTLYGWGIPAALLLPFAVFVIKRARSGRMDIKQARQQLLHAEAAWVFVLWIVPTLGYYIFVHMGQQGLVFVFLPALLLLTAAGFYQVWQNAGRYKAWAVSALALVLLANMVIFLFATVYPLGSQSIKLLTRQTLQEHNQYYLTRDAAVSQDFNPGSTLLLTSAYRFPQYYLPAYQYVSFGIAARWEEGDGTPTLKNSTVIDPAALGLKADSSGYYTIILFDDDLLSYNLSKQQPSSIKLTASQNLYYYRLPAGQTLLLEPQGYIVDYQP